LLVNGQEPLISAIRKKFEPSALAKPIGLKLGIGGGGGSRSCDADDVTPWINELGSVGLKKTPQAAANLVAIMGFFRRAFACNKSRVHGAESWISKSADNDKPACFRVAGFSDADKIRVLIDAALSGKPHKETSRSESGATGDIHPAVKKLDSVLSDVALEVKLCTFRDETLATFLTTALDAITTCLGGHTSTEAMLLFAGTFGWLVSAEAHGGFLGEICSPIQAWGRDFRNPSGLVNAAVHSFFKKNSNYVHASTSSAGTLRNSFKLVDTRMRPVARA
jgi:hypothetical protein